MPTSRKEGEILTIELVADALKLTERTRHRLVGAEKIPTLGLGETRRFSRIDLGHRATGHTVKSVQASFFEECRA
ncbi:MAG: helix-turn-helix domain-containing protein [Candidatus Accumulibacter sp.]|jgi:hypothetical protein|nr:helix-turn-helix domain-containing protein [Accumulibacter sp.]